jgi:hypothetical protein
LDKQEKGTQGAGAEPPAISFSKSKAAFRRLLVIHCLDARFRGHDNKYNFRGDDNHKKTAGMETCRPFLS